MFQKRTTMLTVLALAAAQCVVMPALSTPAWAGPDDGKVVATQSHVDAPKAFYQDGEFVLYTNDTLLEDSVIWAGKGEDRGTPTYQLTLGENGFDFLGKPGETYYATPAVAGRTQNPVWWGYGADVGLPAEDFQNEIVFLDLLAVEGPGDVELLRFYDSEMGPTRLMGTFPDSGRSVKLAKGEHSHNYTVFSKPGRYELTYRVSGRTLDGQLVTSTPQTLAVQVGGNKPLDTATPSLSERFEQAPQSSGEGFGLRMEPSTSENLTDITVTTPHQSGTVTLLIDGFHLTDLPLTDGKATWQEFLGPKSSKIQAVVTTDSGKWISEPLAYQHNQSASTTKSADSWQQPAPKRTFFESDHANLTSTDVTFHFDARSEEYSDIRVETKDPAFRGIAYVDFYSSENARGASWTAEIPIENGKGTFPFEDYESGYTLKARIIPHPVFGEKAVNETLTTNYQRGHSYTAKGSVSPAPSIAQPQPEPETSDAQVLELDKGHVDIAAVGGAEGLDVRIIDETGLHASTSVERMPEDVVLVMRENSFRAKRPEGDEFAFLGEEGIYLAPEQQNRDIVWPGYNTQSLNYAQLGGDVELHVDPVDIPEGAQWGAFTSPNLLQEAEVLLDSSTGKHVIQTGFARHTHLNWAFTKPGTYTFEFSYKAGDTPSTPRKVTFRVEGEDSSPEPIEPPKQEADPVEPPKENQPVEPSPPGGAVATPAKPQPIPTSSFSPWLIVIPGLALLAIVAKVISFARG